MNWRPSSGIATAQRRARMLAQAREFFAAREVLEVETPTLSRAAISDPNIESVEARLALRPGTAYYLRTSPEFCMKRLLGAGYPDIYEIGRVWRDGEAGPRHQPEFTLVEWYRLGLSLGAMVQETVDFVSELIEPQHLPLAAMVIDYREAFERFAGVDAGAAPIAALAAACGADEHLVAALGERRDAWLDLLLAMRVAPRFPTDRLTVLRHYPRSQAALARLCPEDPSVADRFEIFLGEVELANGFVELQDAREQELRIDDDQAARRTDGKPRRPRDDCFIAALRHGLPDCAGVAVGFDRLVMINEMTHDIRRVQAFAFDEEDLT